MESARYTVGLSINPHVRGEILVTAGDRPPSVGVHVYHTADGGEHWREITKSTFHGAHAGLRGDLTPVPCFYEGGAIIASRAGHVMVARDVGRDTWQHAGSVPVGITCVAMPGHSPSSVQH